MPQHAKQPDASVNQLLTKRSSVRSIGTRALIAVGDKNSDSTPYSLNRQHAPRHIINCWTSDSIVKYNGDSQ